MYLCGVMVTNGYVHLCVWVYSSNNNNIMYICTCTDYLHYCLLLILISISVHSHSHFSPLMSPECCPARNKITFAGHS